MRDRGRIVVGVDGLEPSGVALALGAEIADGWGTSLLALHTWREVPDEPGRGGDRVPRRWDHMAAAGRTLLEEALGPVRHRYPDLRIERRVVADAPLGALLDAARCERLLLVGTHVIASGSGRVSGRPAAA